MRLQALLTWWGGQLHDLIPQRRHDLWRQRRATITLQISEHLVTFSGPGPRGLETCELSFDDVGERADVVDAFVASLSKPLRRLAVVLAPNQYLSQRLTLPRVARAHLSETVGYQLPKVTPFTTDQVLYACGELPEATADGPLSVWLLVVPRQRLVQAMALLNRPAPTSPLPVAAPPQPGEPLEMAWNIEESHGAARRRRLVWIGLLCAWIAAFGLHLRNQYVAKDELHETLAELQTESRQVIALRERLAQSAAQLEHVGKLKQASTSSLVLLDTLAKLLDDKTWLQRLDLDSNNLALMGISSSPSALIEKLEASAAFEGVRLDAFTRDNSTQADRFNLSAVVRPPANGGGG